MVDENARKIVLADGTAGVMTEDQISFEDLGISLMASDVKSMSYHPMTGGWMLSVEYGAEPGETYGKHHDTWVLRNARDTKRVADWWLDYVRKQ